MMNSAVLMIARRYLTARRRLRFIHVIGTISIIGIAVGVAALMIALSVFNGFNSVVTSVLVGFDPHIRIEKPGNMTASDLAPCQAVLEKIPEVRAYSPFVAGKAMLVARSYNKVVFLRGVDPAAIGNVSGLRSSMVLGSLDISDTTAVPGIILGLTLADRLASLPHDDLVVYSPAGMQLSLGSITPPSGERFAVAGVFESNNKDYDAGYAYISLGTAQRLFGMEGKYSGIEVRCADFRQADDVKAMLAGKLPAGYMVSTWYDLHRSLYTVMLVERWAAYVLLCLIIVVATFNMLGSLSMSVIEKRRDIAILRSMGMSSRQLVAIFITEGMLVGIVGTIIGLLAGLGILLLQIRYRLFKLDTSIYIIPAIPVEIRWTDFIAIAAASLGLTSLAAWYPARRAASIVPAEALRWE